MELRNSIHRNSPISNSPDKVFLHTSWEEFLQTGMWHHTHTDKCPQLNSLNSHLTLRKPSFLSLCILSLTPLSLFISSASNRALYLRRSPPSATKKNVVNCLNRNSAICKVSNRDSGATLGMVVLAQI